MEDAKERKRKREGEGGGQGTKIGNDKTSTNYKLNIFVMM